MRRRIFAVALACTLSVSLTAGVAFAEHPDAAAASSEAHCRWVKAEADSQSALLYSPSIFVGGGMVSAADVTNGNSGKVEPRVVAGLQISAANFVRAGQ